MRNRNTPRAVAALALATTLIAVALALAEPLPEKAPASTPEPAAPAPQVLAPEPIAPDPAPGYTVDVVAQARLATNEGGLPRASTPTIDGALIGAIVARNAHWAGDVTIAEWIAQAHHRHTRAGRTDGNRWIADLGGTLERPDGWPESRIPWDSQRGRLAWQARLDEAVAVQSGELAAVCPAGLPRSWGGPYVDRCLLLRQLIAGTHRVVAGPPITDCVVTDPVTGEVVSVLTEPATARRPGEQCFLLDDGGDQITTSRNVYLARVRDLNR